MGWFSTQSINEEVSDGSLRADFQTGVRQISMRCLIIRNKYYSCFCLTLLIRITINAVTVMFAVMNLFPKLINAVIVRPVKMYQTIAKRIMF